MWLRVLGVRRGVWRQGGLGEDGRGRGRGVEDERGWERLVRLGEAGRELVNC